MEIIDDMIDEYLLIILKLINKIYLVKLSLIQSYIYYFFICQIYKTFKFSKNWEKGLLVVFIKVLIINLVKRISDG
jgi:hypothetical protein